MSTKLSQLTIVFLLLSLFAAPHLSQKLVCKSPAFAALRPIPKLRYQCREDLNDYDDAVLRQPNRKKALDLYIKTLEKFTGDDWWKSSVEDLNVCDFRQKAGALSESETQDYQSGAYFFKLFGNRQFRIIVAEDPCYQTGFNGANIFLLNRTRGKVFAAEIIDGFFTRTDLPLIEGFARHGSEPVIEIATSSGGLYPTLTNYYFTIDKRTNRAIPKNLFQEGKNKLTNQITSLMLLEDAEAYGLPSKTEPLKIIKNGRLAKSFDILTDTGETFGKDNHQKFERLSLSWNGKFYK